MAVIIWLFMLFDILEKLDPGRSWTLFPLESDFEFSQLEHGTQPEPFATRQVPVVGRQDFCI